MSGKLSPVASTVAPLACTFQMSWGARKGCDGEMPHGISSDEEGIRQVKSPFGMCAVSRWLKSLVFVRSELPAQFVKAFTTMCKPSSLAKAKSWRVVPFVFRVKAEEPT